MPSLSKFGVACSLNRLFEASRCGLGLAKCLWRTFSYAFRFVDNIFTWRNMSVSWLLCELPVAVWTLHEVVSVRFRRRSDRSNVATAFLNCLDFLHVLHGLNEFLVLLLPKWISFLCGFLGLRWCNYYFLLSRTFADLLVLGNTIGVEVSTAFGTLNEIQFSLFWNVSLLVCSLSSSTATEAWWLKGRCLSLRFVDGLERLLCSAHLRVMTKRAFSECTIAEL